MVTTNFVNCGFVCATKAVKDFCDELIVQMPHIS